MQDTVTRFSYIHSPIVVGVDTVIRLGLIHSPTVVGVECMQGIVTILNQSHSLLHAWECTCMQGIVLRLHNVKPGQGYIVSRSLFRPLRKGLVLQRLLCNSSDFWCPYVYETLLHPCTCMPLPGSVVFYLYCWLTPSLLQTVSCNHECHTCCHIS